MPGPNRRKPRSVARKEMQEMKDMIQALHQTEQDTAPPTPTLPHTTTAMQLLRAVGVLVAGFVATAILAGLFLRLTFFVAGI